jgi:hypothetical protein
MNQGHADTVQGIGRTVPVHAVTEMEERIEGEVMEERNIFQQLDRNSFPKNTSYGRMIKQVTSHFGILPERSSLIQRVTPYQHATP